MNSDFHRIVVIAELHPTRARRPTLRFAARAYATKAGKRSSSRVIIARGRPRASCVSHLLGDQPVVRSGRDETYAAGKDTGRYWEAGASDVHWVIATDNQVEQGISAALARVKSSRVLIEGTSLLKFIEADFVVMVARARSGGPDENQTFGAARFSRRSGGRYLFFRRRRGRGAQRFSAAGIGGRGADIRRRAAAVDNLDSKIPGIP